MGSYKDSVLFVRNLGNESKDYVEVILALKGNETISGFNIGLAKRLDQFEIINVRPVLKFDGHESNITEISVNQNYILSRAETEVGLWKYDRSSDYNLTRIIGIRQMKVDFVAWLEECKNIINNSKIFYCY